MISLTEMAILTLYVVALWNVVLPITTFIHECGHAFIALILTDLDVTILLEGKGSCLDLQWGRLRVVVRWFSGFVGFTRYDREWVPTRCPLVITLAGPTMSLLLGFLFWGLAYISSELLWFRLLMKTFAFSTLFQFIFTILPMRYPNWLGGYALHRSDGLRALELLRGQRHHE